MASGRGEHEGGGRAAHEPLSAVDYAWLRMDDPTNLMLINGVLVLGREVEPETIRRVVEERLLVIPRFRQKVVESGVGRPRWVDDPAFQVAAHVLSEPLPEPGGDAALGERVSSLMATPLDPDRPLWCFHLLQGYRGAGGDGPARTVLMARLHHAIGDGIVLMLVLLSLTDIGGGTGSEVDREGTELLNPFSALFDGSDVGSQVERIREHAERLMPDGMKLLLHPADAFREVGRLAIAGASLVSLARLVLRRSDPKTLFNGALTVAKRAAWSRPVSLEAVRELKGRLGVTLNDVLLSAATGSLRRYLDARPGDPLVADFRAAVPVNLRPLERMGELGNYFGLVFLKLPVEESTPEGRLAELRRRLRALKSSAEPVVTYGVLGGLGIVPRAVQKLVVRLIATKATAVVTSVPGPARTLHLAGVPIEDVFFWVPQAGRVGLGLSICSYAGRVRLGVASDVSLVPDPERIVAGFHEELEALGLSTG